MAMSWALNSADVVAVDLNPVAVQQTQTRFRLHDLDAQALQADGKRLPFPDDSFDYVYSWGALHHSPELGWSVAELMRVARPGAGFGVMLYNRRSIHHWYMTRFVEGFLHYESRFLGPLRLASRYGDGAREEGNPYTWPVTRDEILALVRPYSDDAQVRVLGTDLDGIFALMLPGLGLVMPPSMKKVWARRLGWSLWTAGHLR
jgi:SAM-dependent methyltransferase